MELLPHAPLPTEWIGSQLYVAPEVDRQEAYGLPADVFSFGVLAYELYHQLSTGVNFYGEVRRSARRACGLAQPRRDARWWLGAAAQGDMFDGGGMFEGLEVLREPLLADPPQRPDRPDTLESDEMWELLMACAAQAPSERPSFARIAREVGAIRQALAGGALSEWL